MGFEKYDSERVGFLSQEIMRHKRLYYSGMSEISDNKYDRLEEELRLMAPDHPVLSFVGTDTISRERKITHDEPMLSLQKCYQREELFSWLDSHAVVGTWKIDGNSLSVIYQGGRITLAKTRGNGKVGEDVTEKARWVSDLIPKLPDEANLEIRGELYCSQERFSELSREMDLLNLEIPTNPRNIVAGILGRKTHYELARFFGFFAFDVIFPGRKTGFSTEMEKFKWLTERGFRLPGVSLLKSKSEVESYLDRVREKMDDEVLLIDGAVFTYNDTSLHEELGNTSHHPRYKMSFKWQGETGVSIIKEILWSTSRLGIVTPVAVIEPVKLSGAQITNVTLHNCLNVRNNNLKAGDEIEIIRSGEVIPKFLGVVNRVSGKASEPDNCPSCSARLSFDGVRLRCPNQDSCPAQILRGILNWIEYVEIDDLSEKRLENMIEYGLIKTCCDLYLLKKEDFLKLPGTKDKLAEKLFNNIQKSKSVSLARFLCGIGIEGVGLSSCEKLLQHFPSLERILEATREEIEAVEGFAEKSAEQIVAALKTKRPLIEKILSLGVLPRGPELDRSNRDGKLSGKQVVITGKLSKPRSEIEDLIREHGGTAGSSVSKNTFCLICNEDESDSSKMKKAKQLSIPVWKEDDLYMYLGIT
ncbi:MAG: NAD-dependent DNA ligase LigA [Oligoflexales bacterium]|nr:NAD-dependent DNA ligase LigA [Oligoflexales bacterium]